MDENIIRAILLFVIGVILILFPARIYRFQVYIIQKLHVKYDERTGRNYNAHYGIVIIIVSMILFAVAIT
jgi:hypothetical protein